MHVDVIIPALDEEQSVGRVVRSVPRPPVREIYVVDNGSRDETARVAAEGGARVIREERRGYGAACQAGLRALPETSEVVVFLDADGADDASRLPDLIAPILSDEADLVVGSRTLGRTEPGALTATQRLGNRIGALWLRRRFGLSATDLGPFRAIRRDALTRLRMEDRSYGWTVEMQIKAARAGLRYREVAVPYRRRSGGRSKVSGTLRGVLGASVKILGLLALYDLKGWLGIPREPCGAER